MILSTVLFQSFGLATFLSLFGVIQFVPQMVTSMKSIAKQDAVGVPIISTLLRAVYTLTWAIYAAAWFWWGIGFQEIDFPLAVWGMTGFTAFSLQAMSGIVSIRKRK